MSEIHHEPWLLSVDVVNRKLVHLGAYITSSQLCTDVKTDAYLTNEQYVTAMWCPYLVLLCLVQCFARISVAAKQDDDFSPTPPGTRTPIPSLYSRRYSEQTFIGTHDAPAIRNAENNWSLSGNQYFNISVQLNAGVRLLQAQGHRPNTSSDDIRLCHFNCALMDGGSLEDFLMMVKEFLEANPREVVTLLFVNAGVDLRYWMRAYRNTRLDLMSYAPPPDLRYGNMRIADWPTIADMVATNQRLVTFMSSGANEDIAPYLLLEWRYLFETNFGIEAPNQYDCRPARPRWEPPWYVPDRLSLVNHFLYAKFLGFRYPNESYASITNAAGFHVGELGEHAARCREQYERRPNFLLVDFFNEGDVFAVEHGMNAH